MTRRTRALRYGASVAVALAGVVCGAVIPGSAGGTAATVLVGLGLVGIVSLVFYEVGLTEDRDRAAQRKPGEADEHPEHPPDPGARHPEHPPDSGARHQVGRSRPLDRRRGHRRRLP